MATPPQCGAATPSGLPWLSDVMRSQRKTRAGQVPRMEGHAVTLTVPAMRGLPEGWNPADRPRLRWGDALAKDLKHLDAGRTVGRQPRTETIGRQEGTGSEARGLHGQPPEERVM